MKVLHIAAECFPLAKVGGLGDVLGALPKFQNEKEHISAVIIPKYAFIDSKKHNIKLIFEGNLHQANNAYLFKIWEVKNNKEITIFLVEIPHLLDTDYIYSADDTERFLAFQKGILKWLLNVERKPELIHLHDHHAALIPFMMTQCFEFASLKNIPTVFTIHNALYQGCFSHDKINLLPEFDFEKIGLLDWNGQVNPMAAAIKCAWKITTVSPSYMEELKLNAYGIESLIESEGDKCTGILNGIDDKFWNPERDENLKMKYSNSKILTGKRANKKALCKQFGFNERLPLIVFIGRLVPQKGCDLFPNIGSKCLGNGNFSFLILGSGDSEIGNRLKEMNFEYRNNYHFVEAYNEALSHLMYAGADFLLMPSRFEPCGLNQMYALRYGTVPIVTNIGGLKDSVIDIKNEKGYGIVIPECSEESIQEGIKRSIELYNVESASLKRIRNRIVKINNSWTKSANKYNELYQSIIS